MTSDLSDVLRDLVAGRNSKRQPSEGGDDDVVGGEDVPDLAVGESVSTQRDAAEEKAEAETDELAAATIDDEGSDALGTSPVIRSARPARQRNDAQHHLKAAAVPVLVTVGLLLLGVGAWGVAVLLGMEVVLSDRPDAETMARAMALVGFPLAFALLVGAVYFMAQLRRRR